MDVSNVHEVCLHDIRRMVAKHARMWSGEFGTVNNTVHSIELIERACTVRQMPYRKGPAGPEFEAKEVDKMLKAGVITPSNPEWASPVVLAPKKDGTLRLCVDCGKLNALTYKYVYPIPWIDECVDTLCEANIFTTLDALSGFWHVPIAEEDQAKTAFTTHAGLYQFKHMPFGVTNAPSTFQRALDIVLSKYKWQTCLAYIDDGIVFSKPVEDHMYQVDDVL